MTDNDQHLMEAEALEKKFQVEMEAERLREAFGALENVRLELASDPAVRARLRAATLHSWLHLVRTLDHHLDPDFDPSAVPEMRVQPPPTSDGRVLRPGADPASIEDPKARANYEQAIADNRARAERYRLQVHLRRLDERVTPRVEAFIRGAYTQSALDLQELRAAIDQVIDGPHRRAELTKLLSPPSP
jgi:hypothetical protein